ESPGDQALGSRSRALRAARDAQRTPHSAGAISIPDDDRRGAGSEVGDRRSAMLSALTSPTQSRRLNASLGVLDRGEVKISDHRVALSRYDHVPCPIEGDCVCHVLEAISESVAHDPELIALVVIFNGYVVLIVAKGHNPATESCYIDIPIRIKSDGLRLVAGPRRPATVPCNPYFFPGRR